VNPVIRPRAQDDILRQFRWYLVEQDAPEVAFRFLDAVEASVDQLLRVPRMGEDFFMHNPAPSSCADIRARIGTLAGAATCHSKMCFFQIEPKICGYRYFSKQGRRRAQPPSYPMFTAVTQIATTSRDVHSFR
jgi:plasmid stabilization system protein ParE